MSQIDNILSLAPWAGPRRALLITFLGAACAYPTERGEEVVVELDAIPPLIEGEVFGLSSQVTSSITGNQIPNAVVTYASDNPLIAIVSPEGQMLATGVGEVGVTATALGVADAQPGTQMVRIHGQLEIDSLTPRVVRYGELVSIHGSGLSPDSLIATLLGGFETVIEDFTPVDPDQPHRFGVLRIWAKFPAAQNAAVAVFGFNGLAQSPDSTRVLRVDIYEPNDTVPWDFGDLPGSVANPALAFERRGRDSIGIDWYRFTQVTTGDRSFVIKPGGTGSGGFQVFITNNISWQGLSTGFAFGANAWIVSPTLTMCNAIPLAPPRFPDDSVIVALKDLPPGDYNLFTVSERQSAYGMGILNTYRSHLPPDPAEENDYCDVAAPLAIGTTRNYNIDNPHDLDWFKVTLPDTTNLTLDVVAENPEADLDLYVLRDFLPDSLQLLSVGQTEGTVDGLAGRVPPGDYFVLVVDFRGITTLYTIRGDDVATLPDHQNIAVPIETFRRFGDGNALPFRSASNAPALRR